MPFQRRAQHGTSVCVAKQMREPQQITYLALRSLFYTAGKSAGSQIFIDPTDITPADDSCAVTPDKIWAATGDGPDDIRKAFSVVQIPNVTEELMQIIQLGERFAEETTSIPL